MHIYLDLVKHHVLQLPTTNAKQVLLSATTEDDKQAKRPTFPKPDLDQMIPFKPRVVVPPGSHLISGGVFPPPPAVASLMLMLPPPSSFHGPHVITDKLMEFYHNVVLPDGPVGIQNGKNGDVRLDAGTRHSIELATGMRKRKQEANSEEDDEDNAPMAPINDIYRARQQKKVAK